MKPISPTPTGFRGQGLKRKADEDLAGLMEDMILGNGKGRAPEKRSRVEVSPAPRLTSGVGEAGPSTERKSLKRRATESGSEDEGPSARAAQTETPKRTRMIPRGQTEKAYAGGDRDFKNPDGSSVHKPMQGPVSVHFGHGTTVIDNGGTVKIDHSDGTTVLARQGEAPTVLKPFGKPPTTLPGGGRLEHLEGGDARIYLQDRVVTHFGSGLTRTDMHPVLTGQRGYFETDSDGSHRFVEMRESSPGGGQDPAT